MVKKNNPTELKSKSVMLPKNEEQETPNKKTNEFLETTCIVCPIGCNLKIEKLNNDIKVTGNLCPRGEAYGKTEITNPSRVITCSVPCKEKIYFVKTSLPVPKKLMFNVIEEIKKIPPKNFNEGEVILKNILNTGSDIIVTGSHSPQQDI